MEATSLAEAREVLRSATLDGYDASMLTDLLDFARVVPSPVLDRVRSDFVVDRPDPYGRLA